MRKCMRRFEKTTNNGLRINFVFRNEIFIIFLFIYGGGCL